MECRREIPQETKTGGEVTTLAMIDGEPVVVCWLATRPDQPLRPATSTYQEGRARPKEVWKKFPRTSSDFSISMKEPPRRDELRSMVLDAGRCDGCRQWVGGAATS